VKVDIKIIHVYTTYENAGTLGFNPIRSDLEKYTASVMGRLFHEKLIKYNKLTIVLNFLLYAQGKISMFIK